MVAVVGISLEPLQSHAGGVEALQQGQAIAQEAAVLEAQANRLPALPIPLTLAALGGELQGPTQPQRPPVASTIAGPMQPLVQSAHRWGEGVGQVLRIGIEQLAQALIREAVGAHLSSAPGLLADPAQRVRGVAGLLGKAAEITTRITPAADVLNQDCKSSLGVPTRMGIGDRRGNGAAVGLAHQQARPRAFSCGCPKRGGQDRAVRAAQLLLTQRTFGQ